MFEYLKGLNKAQKYWFAVGSNQHVYNSDNGTFVEKADDAYKDLNDAITKAEGIETALQKLFGTTTFANTQNYVLKEYNQYSFKKTEQFIENMFPVDIR